MTSSDNHVRPRVLAIAARSIFAALAAAVPLALLEVAYVLLVRRPGFDSPGQVALFALQVLAMLAGTCALLGLVQGPITALVALVSRRLPAWCGESGRRMAAVAALLAAPAVGWLAHQMLAGRRASLLPLRPLLLLLIAAAMAAVVFGGISLLLAAHRRLSDGCWSWAHASSLVLGSLALAAVTYAADQRLLPGLYPALHLSLCLATVALVQAACSMLLRVWWTSADGRARVRASLALPVLVLLALAGGWWAWAGLGASEPLRYVTFGHTVLGARAAGLARAWLPSPAWSRPPAPGTASPRVTAPRLRPGPRLPGSNILLITVDALRADHMGLYGYRRPTTPGIDRWAREAVVFERAYCPTPHTSYALVSLLAGRQVVHRDVPPERTVARWLREQGFHTAGFFPPAVFYTDGDHFRALERTRLDFSHVDYAHHDARTRVDRVLAHLRGLKAGQLFFIWVHLFEPHEPYTPPDGLAFGPRDVDRYDGEILAVDRQVARLLEQVRSLHPRTAVALTADHGEAFGEHGAFYHGTNLHEEQVRVPAVVSVPGVPGRRVAGAVSIADFAPTLLAAAGIAVPPEMSGTDLGPWLLGEDPMWLPPVVLRLFSRQAVVHGSWKLMHHAAWNYRELYDLHADPGERRNLAAGKTELTAALHAYLVPTSRRPARSSGQKPPQANVVTLSAELRQASDVYRRHDLIRRLGRLGDSAAAEVLQEQLLEPRTRQAALEALGQVRARAAVPALIRALGSDPYVTWRRAAAFSLGRIGDARALGALQRSVLVEPEPAVAAQALEALARLGALPPEGTRHLASRSWSCAGGHCVMSLDASCDPTLELLVLLEEGAAAAVQCGGQQVASLDADQVLPGTREPDRPVPAMVVSLTSGALTLTAGREPRVRYLGIRRTPTARAGAALPADETGDNAPPGG